MNTQIWLSCPFSLIFLFPVTNLIRHHTRYNDIYPVLLRIFTVPSPFNILDTILVYCATDKQNDHLPDEEYVLLLVRNIINSMPPPRISLSWCTPKYSIVFAFWVFVGNKPVYWFTCFPHRRPLILRCSWGSVRRSSHCAGHIVDTICMEWIFEIQLKWCVHCITLQCMAYFSFRQSLMFALRKWEVFFELESTDKYGWNQSVVNKESNELWKENWKRIWMKSLPYILLLFCPPSFSDFLL
jgi:hypothetical protein